MARTRTAQRNALEALSWWATNWTGSSWAFALAICVVFVWLLTGPFFHYSDTWQLVINTGTTIVTFLMVFLIQRAQNKDARAIQLKLNELVASSERASNRLIGAETLTEEELRILQRYYEELVDLARRDASLTKSHTIEEADARARRKARREAARAEAPRTNL